MRRLQPWACVIACVVVSAGCLEEPPLVEQDSQALAYACGAGTVDVCAGKTKDDLMGPGGNCFLPPDTGPMMCSPQCEPDADGDGKADNEAKCKVIVVGATQDQCPPEPGCCLRTSEPNDDSEAESQTCDWALGSDWSCPSKWKGECPTPGAPTACSTDFDWICHSLGGAWCQCNQIDGLYIGTQCPTDRNGNVCAGSCCVNSDGAECADPVGGCIDMCCTGRENPAIESACVLACMMQNNDPPTPGDPSSLDCHNSPDYFDCLQYGLPIDQGACARWPGLPGGSCLEGPPNLPECDVGPDGAVYCDCGPDEPYCGDIGRACCSTDCGANDGCGPCMTCTSGSCVYVGGAGCVPPWDDWDNQWNDLPPDCYEVDYPWWIPGIPDDYYVCEHACPPCNNSFCPTTQQIEYHPDGTVKQCGSCCSDELCAMSDTPSPVNDVKTGRAQKQVVDFEAEIGQACQVLVQGTGIAVEYETEVVEY